MSTFVLLAHAPCVPDLLIKRLYVCSGCPVGSGCCNDYEILEEPESEGESQLYCLFMSTRVIERKHNWVNVSKPHTSRSRVLILYLPKNGEDLLSFTCQ